MQPDPHPELSLLRSIRRGYLRIEKEMELVRNIAIGKSDQLLNEWVELEHVYNQLGHNLHDEFQKYKYRNDRVDLISGSPNLFESSSPFQTPSPFKSKLLSEFVVGKENRRPDGYPDMNELLMEESPVGPYGDIQRWLKKRKYEEESQNDFGKRKNLLLDQSSLFSPYKQITTLEETTNNSSNTSKLVKEGNYKRPEPQELDLCFQLDRMDLRNNPIYRNMEIQLEKDILEQEINNRQTSDILLDENNEYDLILCKSLESLLEILIYETEPKKTYYKNVLLSQNLMPYLSLDIRQKQMNDFDFGDVQMPRILKNPMLPSSIVASFLHVPFFEVEYNLLVSKYQKRIQFMKEQKESQSSIAASGKEEEEENFFENLEQWFSGRSLKDVERYLLEYEHSQSQMQLDQQSSHSDTKDNSDKLEKKDLKIQILKNKPKKEKNALPLLIAKHQHAQPNTQHYARTTSAIHNQSQTQYTTLLQYSESSGVILDVCLAQSPFGLKLATGSTVTYTLAYNRLGNLTLFDFGTGELRVLEGHCCEEAGVRNYPGVSYEEDPNLYNQVHIPCFEHPRPLNEFRHYITEGGQANPNLFYSSVTQCLFTNGNDFLLSSSYDGCCLLWSVLDGRPMRMFYGNGTTDKGHVYDFIQGTLDDYPPTTTTENSLVHREQPPVQQRERQGRRAARSAQRQLNEQQRYLQQQRRQSRQQSAVYHEVPGINRMAVHPTHPYLFSNLCSDGSLFLWDLRGVGDQSEGRGVTDGHRLSVGSSGSRGSTASHSRSSHSSSTSQQDVINERVNRRKGQIYHYRSGHRLIKQSDHEGAALKFGHAHNEHLLLTGHEAILQEESEVLSGSGILRLLDVNQLKEVQQWKHFPNTNITDLEWSPDGQSFLVGTSGDGILRMYDVHQRECVVSIHTIPMQEDMNLVSYSPCGTLIGCGGTDDKFFLYDKRFTNKPLLLLTHQRQRDKQGDGIKSVLWQKPLKIPICHQPFHYELEEPVIRPLAEMYGNGDIANVVLTCGTDGRIQFWDPFKSQQDCLLGYLSTTGDALYSMSFIKKPSYLTGLFDEQLDWMMTHERLQHYLDILEREREQYIVYDEEWRSWAERVGGLGELEEEDLLVCGNESGRVFAFTKEPGLFRHLERMGVGI